jgi:hypothetical protein
MRDIKQLIKEVLSKHTLDCGCGCNDGCAKAPMINENLNARIVMTENMKYHITNKKPLTENTFRYGSNAFLDLWAEARYLYSRDAINLSGDDKKMITETNLGEYGIYEGQNVPLDMPMSEENTPIKPGDKVAKKFASTDGDYVKEYEVISITGNSARLKDINTGMVVGMFLNDLYKTLNESESKKLNKPHRGGASGKKYYVYVRDPKTKKTRKISFGDAGGLKAKINDPKARKAFSARHDCPNKKDKTKASYWSCRLPKYAKLLGIKSSFTGYW